MNLQLDGKVTPVTGASKGIGWYVAEHPATEGTWVAITARTPGPLGLPAREFQSGTGRRVLALAGDMSVTPDVTRCEAATEDRIDPIDILVTCAASFARRVRPDPRAGRSCCAGHLPHPAGGQLHHGAHIPAQRKAITKR